MNFLLIFVFISAFLIRLISLNQSLWLDEAITAQVVKQFDYLSIVSQFSPFDFHPPLYYLFMKFWTNIFGYSEIFLRLPSVIFSLASGYFVYLVGKLVGNKKSAFWAVLFFLFNPLIIYYSQEARVYMLATFLLTASLYFFLKILKKNSYKDQVFFGIFIFLAFVSFYGSIFLIFSFLIFFLFKKRYDYFFKYLLFLLFSILIISPLLYQQLINAKVLTSNVSHWFLVLGQANLKNLLLIPLKFSIGRIDFHPKIVYYLIGGSWSFFVFYFLIKSKNSEFKIVFLYLFTFPIFLAFVFSFFIPLLQYFRFIYFISIVAILLSSVDDLNKKRLFLGFLIFSLVYLFFPQFHREDWKSLASSLKEKTVYLISSSSSPLTYYKKDLTIKDLRLLKDYSLEEKVVVIPYTAEIYGLRYQDILKEKKYFLFDNKTFHQLEVEYWRKIN